MSDIIVISNSSICKEDFLLRIEKLAKAKPKAIVLREKHLPENDYEDLAKKVIEICNKYNTQCILHNFPKVAEKLNHNALHLPLQVLATLTDKEKSQYKILGASCSFEACGRFCPISLISHSTKITDTCRMQTPKMNLTLKSFFPTGSSRSRTRLTMSLR